MPPAHVVHAKYADNIKRLQSEACPTERANYFKKFSVGNVTDSNPISIHEVCLLHFEGTCAT